MDQLKRGVYGPIAAQTKGWVRKDLNNKKARQRITLIRSALATVKLLFLAIEKVPAIISILPNDLEENTGQNTNPLLKKQKSRLQSSYKSKNRENTD